MELNKNDGSLAQPSGAPSYGSKVARASKGKKMNTRTALKDFVTNCSVEWGPCVPPWPKNAGPAPQLYIEAQKLADQVREEAAAASTTPETPKAQVADTTQPNCTINGNKNCTTEGQAGETITGPQDHNQNITKCGGYCSTRQDCGTGDDATDCECREPREQEALSYGIDPVFPRTLCLVFLKATSNRKYPMLHGRSGERGSEIGEDLDLT